MICTTCRRSNKHLCLVVCSLGNNNHLYCLAILVIIPCFRRCKARIVCTWLVASRQSNKIDSIRNLYPLSDLYNHSTPRQFKPIPRVELAYAMVKQTPDDQTNSILWREPCPSYSALSIDRRTIGFVYRDFGNLKICVLDPLNAAVGQIDVCLEYSVRPRDLILNPAKSAAGSRWQHSQFGANR